MSLPDELQAALDPEANGSSPGPSDLKFALSDTHTLALALRVPMWAKDEQPGVQAKIAALEDYLLLAAFYVGALQQERTEAHVELAPKEQAFDDLQVSGKTGPERDRNRQTLRPPLWREIKQLRWQIDRLTETLERLDREHDKISRAYTLMSGG